MNQIKVHLKDNRSYPIIIQSGSISNMKCIASYLSSYSKILVVTNERIFKLYGEKLKKGFSSINKKIEICLIPQGEQYKNIKTVNEIYTQCLLKGLDRKSLIVAFGGGVIGDMAGFAAATYMRGIDLMQIPTTLLAQVDSSVGGKVGVNHRLGKNMIGAFYQPKLVLIDVDVLKTLAQEEFNSGMAEVIKYGVILDQDFFCFLEKNINKIKKLDKKTLEKIIYQCCLLKAKVVEKDEKESGLRAILNFGHTIGHAIETVTKYRVYTHGQAIAMGMVYASLIAFNKGLFLKEKIFCLENLLLAFDLPIKIKKVNIEKICTAIKSDKKFQQGKINFVLPKEIGKIFISKDVTMEEIKMVLR